MLIIFLPLWAMFMLNKNQSSYAVTEIWRNSSHSLDWNDKNSIYS